MGIREQIRHGDSPGIVDTFCAVDDPVLTLARVGPDNPTRRRCELELVAVDGPSGRGRAAAIINPRLLDDTGAPIGLVGFFASDRNPDTARWLFDYACEWLARRGCKIVRGPINFTTWHEYRLVSKVHVDVAVTGEPVHPDYYPELWREAGFQVASNYCTNWFPDMAELVERWSPIMRKAGEDGYVTRPIEPADLPVLHRLAMDSFADAYMFSAIELDEFVALYTPDRARRAAGNTRLAISPDGEPVGFIYTFDVPFDDGQVGVVKTVGVARSQRGKGAYQLLKGGFFRDQVERGATRAVAALMHADGAPRKMGWIAPDTLIKEYQLYERAL